MFIEAKWDDGGVTEDEFEKKNSSLVVESADFFADSAPAPAPGPQKRPAPTFWLRLRLRLHNTELQLGNSVLNPP